MSLYQGPYGPLVLEDIGVVLTKANSAIATLEKYTRRLREEARNLTVHEYDGAVTLREVVGAVGTFEYSARIAEEIEAYVRELGSEGRLVEMQLEQAFHGVPEQYEALLRDYVEEEADYRAVREELRTLGRGAPTRPGSPPSATTQRAGRRSCSLDPRIPPTRAGAAPAAQGRREPHQGVRLPRRDPRSNGGGARRGRGVGQARARSIQRGLERQRSLETTGEVT